MFVYYYIVSFIYCKKKHQEKTFIKKRHLRKKKTFIAMSFFNTIKPKSDCIYHFPIDAEPNVIPKVWPV